MATTITPSTLSVKNIFLLIAGCIILCASASWIGTTFTMDGMQGWYQVLVKPSFTPPYTVFAPVWFVLYLMMAISLFYVLRAHHPNKNAAVGLFLTQLILNVLWSFIFFKMHHIGLALVEMIALMAVLIAYYFITKPIRALSAYLFIPYILWVAFATLLTASIWSLN